MTIKTCKTESYKDRFEEKRKEIDDYVLEALRRRLVEQENKKKDHK